MQWWDGRVLEQLLGERLVERAWPAYRVYWWSGRFLEAGDSGGEHFAVSCAVVLQSTNF